MGFKILGVTHWSIPVNDLAESEEFYEKFLGLENRGRLGNSGMTCFRAGDHEILLCERKDKVRRTPEQDNRLHHSFHMSPEDWLEGVKALHRRGIKPIDPIVYREQGFFTGAEIYVPDPSGNTLEFRNPEWRPGMPKPTFEELVGIAETVQP
jgi:catechol 2,3-dioxygenase-like lactoylglutathione lyase family enzyme